MSASMRFTTAEDVISASPLASEDLPLLDRAVEPLMELGWRGEVGFLYDPPEGGKGVEAASYRVAALLYQLAVGRPPFPASTATAVSVKQRLERPLPLPDGVDPQLAEAILQALSPDWRLRPDFAEWLPRTDDGDRTGLAMGSARRRAAPDGGSLHDRVFDGLLDSPSADDADPDNTEISPEPAPARAAAPAAARDTFDVMGPPPEPTGVPGAAHRFPGSDAPGVRPLQRRLLVGVVIASVAVVVTAFGVGTAWLGLPEGILGAAFAIGVVGHAAAFLIHRGLGQESPRPTPPSRDTFTLTPNPQDTPAPSRSAPVPPPPRPQQASPPTRARPRAVPAPQLPEGSYRAVPAPIGDDVGEGFVPFRIGPYRCFGVLGEGGMGVVYKARHVDLGRLCAVKLLHPGAATNERSVARFRREARLAASITHPNSVLIYDFGVAEDAMFFLAMEFVQGTTLASRIAACPALPLRTVVEIAAQIGEALEMAHRAGVVHRDLKPQNVMVSGGAGGRPVVKVLDFGIAIDTADGLTRSAAAPIGTPAYMSPEQARGLRDIDARTDVYSFGLLVYEALTGTLPFFDPTASPLDAAFRRASVVAPPRGPAAAFPDLALPPDIDGVVARALQPDRTRRTPSAAQFAQEFAQAAGGGVGTWSVPM